MPSVIGRRGFITSSLGAVTAVGAGMYGVSVVGDPLERALGILEAAQSQRPLSHLTASPRDFFWLPRLKSAALDVVVRDVPLVSRLYWPAY